MQHFVAFWLVPNLILDLIVIIGYFSLGKERYIMKKFFAKVAILIAILTLILCFVIAVNSTFAVPVFAISMLIFGFVIAFS